MSSGQLRRQSGAIDFGGDDRNCTVLHVDMDAFYASVSLLDRPDLHGTPVIVGGSGSRGVVLSASYEARALGVHSAMPMGRARRLAPQAVVLPPDHERYSRVSAGVMEVFRSFTPWVEPISLDEAFLDIAGARRVHGSATRIAEEIRARVFDEQSVTCSVGVAASKFVAKLASGRCKPDGLLVVPPDRVIDFLHPMPVGALWGVGEKTEERLTRLVTVADIAAVPVETLIRALGPAAGRHLHDLAWGRDERSVTPHEPDRSMGADETFGQDVDDPEVIRAELLRLSAQVAARMRRAGYVGRTVQIKVRFADFTTITRSRTLSDATDVGHVIYTTAIGLYERLGLQRARLRLIGVRVEHLQDAETAVEQLLLNAPEHGRRDVERALDDIAGRFGKSMVQPARLVHPLSDSVRRGDGRNGRPGRGDGAGRGHDGATT